MKSKTFRIILALLALVSVLCFASCKPQLDILPNARFVAKVTEVSDGQVLVTVIDKGTSSLANDTPVYVSTNFEGYVAPAVGDYVIVEYNHVVQEIYPPILPHVFSITKCDSNGNPLK